MTKRRQLFLMASLLHILNDGCRVAIVALVPLVTETLGLSYTQVGLLGTVLSGIQTATALPASLAAQRLGDILVLQFGLLLYALPSSLIGWVTGYPFLLLLFCAAGIGFGVFHPVGSAFVAKVSPPQRLGRSLGAFTSAGDIGKVGLPALITLLLTRTSLTVTSSALGLAGILALVSSILATKYVRTDWSAGSDTKQARAEQPLPWTRVGRQLPLALILSSLDSFTQEPMMLFMPLLMLARGSSADTVGLTLSAYFAGSFVGKSLLGHVADRQGSAATIILAKTGAAVLVVFLASCVHSAGVLLVALFALGSLNEGTAPVTKTMLGESLPIESYNLAFGTSGTLNALLAGLSSFFFGLVADRFRIESVFYVNAVFIVLMICLSVVYQQRRTRRTIK